MKSGTRLAVGAGYVLGRRRKLRLAAIIGAAALTGGAGGVTGQVLRRGTKLVGSALGSTEVLGKVSPQLGELTGIIRNDLLDAGKSAARTAVNSRIDSLSDRLRDRADALRNPPAAEEEHRNGARAADEEAGWDSAADSGVYAYEFSDPNPPNDFGIAFTFPLGAAHSTELQYVFQKIPVLDTTPPFTPAQLALSDQIIGYWSRFAASGTPNGEFFSGERGEGEEAPHWPRFTAFRQRIQELVPDATAPTPAASFAAGHQCAFWATIEG